MALSWYVTLESKTTAFMEEDESVVDCGTAGNGSGGGGLQCH
jgi:hypothetical protein